VHVRPTRIRLPLLAGLLTLAVCLVAGATAAAPAPAATAQLVRIGAAPVLPDGTQPLADIASSQSLRVTIALQPRNAAELTAYADAVADPTSPDYRHYLSTPAFAARFGPTTASIDAVRRALTQAGLTPGALAANHLSFDVVADAGTLEQAFHVDLAHVLLPTGKAALVDIEAPAVPAAVAPDIQAIVGLNGMATMHTSLERAPAARTTPSATRARAATAPRAAPSTQKASLNPRSATPATARRAHQTPTACSAASTTASAQGAYTTNQIADAYRFDGLYAAGDEGAGVTIGVYELEPNLTSDIAAYQACYGTDTSVTYQEVDGGAGTGAGSGEATLDIEQLIGLAPKAKLIVYQGPNSNSDAPGSGPYDIFAEMISQDQVQVISNSWGECEAMEGAADARAENTLFEEAAVQGQSVLSAAGDDGSEDCLGASGGVSSTALAVDDPGSQPFVTDVGGTSLTALGPPPTEVTWNSGGGSLSALGLADGYGAGGGGISSFWAMPGYQVDAPASLDVINANSTGTTCAAASGDCREVPDVSADADPNHGYVIYYNGNDSVQAPTGWQGTGGTSGAAPLWAAVFALADADSACAGTPIGFANPALYRAAAAGQTSYFNDVTSGDNDFSDAHHGLYPAGVGYDMATGLGSPSTTVLATELCQQSLRLTVAKRGTGFVSTHTTSASGATTTTGESLLGTPVSLLIHASAATGVSASVAVTGLPQGLSFDATTDTISGTPTKLGVDKVTVEAADADEAVRSDTFTWHIAEPPTVSHLKLTGLGAAAPVLSLRLTPGRDEAALSSARLTLPAGLTLAKRAKVVVRALAGNKVIRHTLTGAGRRITLAFTAPAGPVVLQFSAGALRSTRGLARSARVRVNAKLTVALALVDSAGESTALHGSLRSSAPPT
jgi:subtilase family serine protease